MIARKLLISLSFCLLLFSCNGPKSLTKKGNKFSQAGIHEDAISYYEKALDKKPDYIEALIGLKNSSREVFNVYTSKFFKAYTAGDYKTAVYTYRNLDRFVKRANLYKAGISIPQQYQDDFKDAKEIYVKNKFEEANQLISEDKFKEADVLFKEIEKIDPNFEGEDFDALKDIALLEPPYRAGIKFINDSKYRSAYHKFNFISKRNKNYKDSKFKKDEALENAQFNVGVLKFKNYSRDKSAGEYIAAELITTVLKRNDPFTKLIDRSNTEQLINEQTINNQGMTESNNAIATGELIGAKALLQGIVLKIERKNNKLSSKYKKAYKSKRVKKYDSVKKKNYYVTEYDKVQYAEYTGKNAVTVTFKIQLLSSETGQIIFSEILKESFSSSVNYSSYKGNYKNIVPGSWKSISTSATDDHVITKSSSVKRLQNSFKANKTLTSLSDLQDQAQKSIAHKCATKLLSYNPEN